MLLWPNLALTVLFGSLIYRAFGQSVENGMLMAAMFSLALFCLAMCVLKQEEP